MEELNINNQERFRIDKMINKKKWIYKYKILRKKMLKKCHYL